MQHFAIIAAPRSGSTRLCDILGRHPSVACHNEIFHPDEVQAHFPRDLNLEIMNCAFRDADPKAFLDKFLAFNEQWFRGRQRHGFKVMLDRNQLLMMCEVVCPDPRLAKILLYRENLLAGYASVALAMATGVWHRTRPESESAPGPKIEFDWDRFYSFAGEQIMARAAAEDAMRRSHQLFLPLTYEETLTKRGMSRVWDFLNLPAGDDEGNYRKTNTRRLLDCFSNPDVVVRAARSVRRPDWLDA
jgi:hypothetical protein